MVDRDVNPHGRDVSRHLTGEVGEDLAGPERPPAPGTSTGRPAGVAMRTVALAAVISGVLVGACARAPSPPPSAAPRLGLYVGNGTALTVTLLVNGKPVGTSAPGSPPEVPSSALPPLPWSVAATTASGRVLATMEVSVSDATQSDPNMHVIPMGRVDLSCGRLTIWAGDHPPSGPVPASPAGSPGDCEP
jgi:hypothetical protein